MKVAVDPNVLAYAEGTNGTVKRDRALEVLQRLPPTSIVLPVQTLGELFHVLVRKAGGARAVRGPLCWGGGTRSP